MSPTRKEQIHTIIFGTSTPAGALFDKCLLVLIIASVAVVMLDSIELLHERYDFTLNVLEWVFTLVFTAELALRLYCHPRPIRGYLFTFYGMVDVLAILPGYLGLFFGDLQYLLMLRVLRLMRVFRVLKLVQFSTEARTLMRALIASRNKILVFMLSVMTLVFCFGALMYVIEGPENGFTSIPKSVYWAIVTLTTVGYGDIAPQTPLGQAIAGLVMLTGYSIIAVPTGIFGAEMARAVRHERQLKHSCPRCKKDQHEEDASFCNRCGSALFVDEPASSK